MLRRFVSIGIIVFTSALLGLGQGSSQPKPDEIVEGLVVLKVQFLSSGQIGKIEVVKALPNGLAEQAIAAARKIKFDPAKQNGVPVEVTKQIEYTFTIYYDENSPDLSSNAVITKLPAPEFPKAAVAANTGKRIVVSVGLSHDGKVLHAEAEGDLPMEIKAAAVKAAARIKFRPAIHKTGKAVDQLKSIEYEVK